MNRTFINSCERQWQFVDQKLSPITFTMILTVSRFSFCMFHVFPCVAVCLSLYVRNTVAQTFVSLVSYNYVYLCVSEIMVFKLDSLLLMYISICRKYCCPNFVVLCVYLRDPNILFSKPVFLLLFIVVLYYVQSVGV